MTKAHPSFKDVKSLTECKALIDSATLLQWQELKHLKKVLPLSDQATLVKNFIDALGNNSEDRLHAEIIVESLLLWFTYSCQESDVKSFLDTLVTQQKDDKLLKLFIEIALTADPTDQEHEEKIYCMSVMLICEIGINVYDLLASGICHFPQCENTLLYLNTYLQSVSNSNHFSIRLALFHYFGHTAALSSEKGLYPRIMNRFGHSVLDSLFEALFNKKTESVALHYLLNNIPYILAADHNCQKILHDTFKAYILKQPDHFNSFLQKLTENIQSGSYKDIVNKTYIQHLGALFNVISEVHHSRLAKEILSNLLAFKESEHFVQLLTKIENSSTIRPEFKKYLEDIRRDLNHMKNTRWKGVLHFQEGLKKPKTTIPILSENVSSGLASLRTIAQVVLLESLLASKAA